MLAVFYRHIGLYWSHNSTSHSHVVCSSNSSSSSYCSSKPHYVQTWKYDARITSLVAVKI